MKAWTEGEVAAKPLGDLSPFSRPRAFHLRLFGGFCVGLSILICFRHLVYHFFAYLSHEATYVPTVETVEE